MTIQISVTIWTIICFVLLVIILNNLLFKPVLKCMDERKARIAAAHKKKEEYDRLSAEHEVMLAEKLAENEVVRKKLIKERVETIRNNQKKAVEAAKEVRLHQLDDYRRKTEEEEAEILSKLSSHAREMAIMLADNIVKG